MNEQSAKDSLGEFVGAARAVAGHGLVVRGSGNLSCRLAEDRMLITATGSSMADLSEDQVAVCRISDGARSHGADPSKEIGFHAGVFRQRPDVNAVLHFQSPCATTLACRRPQVADFGVIPEIPYYIGPVAWVPYLLPGSRELADAVTDALLKHDLAMLRCHGQVVVARSLGEVIDKAAYFELACRVILGAGASLETISAEGVAELLRAKQASAGV